MVVLHFSMQGEDINEHTNGKCHVLTFQVARGKYFGSTLRSSVIFVHFSQIVDLFCNIGIHLITLLNICMPRY